MRLVTPLLLATLTLTALAPAPAARAPLANGVAGEAAAVDWGAPGPHSVGWRDVAFVDNGEDFTGRIYYPATSGGEGAEPDSAAGPYPLLGFTHGQGGAPSDYDQLLTHIASWGWVVSAVQTFGDANVYAKDTKKILKWTNLENAEPASFLFGMISEEHDWAGMGHSWGGGAQQYLVEFQKKVRAVVCLQPAYFTQPVPIDYLSSYDGSILVITGNQDVNTPADTMGFPLYGTAASARRGAYVKVQGMAHYGPVDEPPPNGIGNLEHAKQAELNRRMATAFLMSEIRGVEDAWAGFTGETAVADPLLPEARCFEPPLWVEPSASEPGVLRVGAAGRADGTLFLMAAGGPGSFGTPLGTLDLDPATLVFVHRGPTGAEGWVEASLPVPPRPVGASAWFQAAIVGPEYGAISRSVEWSAD